jgi:TonB family protein
MKQAGLSLALVMAAGCATVSTEGTLVPLAPPPRPIAELVAQLSAPDAPSRASAAWALAGAEKPDLELLAALKMALDDPSGPVREAATWALGHMTLPDSEKAALSTDTPPRLLVQTRPNYPNTAFNRKLQGIVRVEILINETGRVAHAEVRRSIPELDKAALECVRNWQFAPAQRAGKPVAVVAQSPVSFRIY